jgi:flavin-dependent dehydrogenase
MSSTIKCDVLIAGTGPAGLATALHLLRAHPELKGRVVAIEKASHPRPKTCAGGLIPKTMLALKELGLDLEVPAIEVMRGTARTEIGEVEMFRGDPLCTVIRRDQFDARLARAAKQAGLEIIDHCRVWDVEQSGGTVRVRTERSTFETPVLVGADGSGSRVRASIFGRGKESIGRALMLDIPVDPERTREFIEQRYVFDFKCVVAGTSGYAWSFPCLIDHRPHLNVGIYDQHPPHSCSSEKAREKSPLPDRLREAFPELDLAGFETRAMNFKAFPIRWFNPKNRFVNDRVMLAGDAAGVDPLMGEGISCAFEHGKLAARHIGELLGGDRAALTRYDAALHTGAVGRKLGKLAFAARHFYGPRHRLYFKLAGLSAKAQSVGVDWYNGADNFDELPVRALLGKWMRAMLFDSPVR